VAAVSCSCSHPANWSPRSSDLNLISLPLTLAVRLILRGPFVLAHSCTLLGVGQSTPPAKFFTNDAQRQFFDFSANGIDANATSDVGANIPRLWAQSQVLGRLAEDNDNGILPHIHTTNVARDMLAMAEASGQKKLQYWGIS
jgi:hypothetical protein